MPKLNSKSPNLSIISKERSLSLSHPRDVDDSGYWLENVVVAGEVCVCVCRMADKDVECNCQDIESTLTLG